MKLPPIVIAFALIGLVLFWISPSCQLSRDSVGEKIDNSGYFQAFYCLNRAMEEHVLRHYGVLPSSIEQLVAAEMSELGAERESDARSIAAIVSRVVIKPHYRDARGNHYSWLVAALVPKGTAANKEYVEFQFGDSETVQGSGRSYLPAAEFATTFGSELLDEVRQRDASPAPLTVLTKPRPAVLPGHQGSWPDRSAEPRWWIAIDTDRVAKSAASMPSSGESNPEIWESRRLTTFLRPLTFARGAWEVSDRRDGLTDSQACRLALNVPSNGGAGDDTVRLSLRSLRNGVITLRTDIKSGNQAKLLYLSLTDANGRVARWDYDLPGPSQVLLRPRGDANLSNPNLPPADGIALDVGRIVKWELHGDPQSTAKLSVTIHGIDILGSRETR